MYENGTGVAVTVAQDFREAARWYTLAAAQGHAKAQCNLGVMHGHGTGMAQDYKEAVRWYTLAAAQGHGIAQHNLGAMHTKGSGGLV